VQRTDENIGVVGINGLQSGGSTGQDTLKLRLGTYLVKFHTRISHFSSSETGFAAWNISATENGVLHFILHHPAW